MFNVKMSPSGLLFDDNGRGKWLRLHVPIEYNGKREDLDITLTANDATIRYGISP